MHMKSPSILQSLDAVSLDAASESLAQRCLEVLYIPVDLSGSSVV